MRERPDDKRVVKTIRTIHATFEQMMCEMDYRDITVKELCERALVNKKTFYRYYETLNYLLKEFQEDMISAYLARVEGLHRKTYSYRYGGRDSSTSRLPRRSILQSTT